MIRLGDEYVAHASGNTYRVEALGDLQADDQSNLSTLKLVRMSEQTRAEWAADAKTNRQPFLVVLQEAFLRRLKVEPLWFHKAARRVS